MTHGTLYVSRPLENADQLREWAKAQGFKTAVPANDMHVTVMYSKTPLEWPGARDDRLTVPAGNSRTVEPLGGEGAVVLKFKEGQLKSRWSELLEAGAKSDFPDYIPHVTLSYNAADMDLSAVKPYTGPLVFGPEVMQPVDEDWKDKIVEKVMPLSPGKGESEDDFIGRCMSAEKASFPDQKQRLAVCFSMWRENKTEKGFDPNQPREPKGSPEGGQWSDGGSPEGRQWWSTHVEERATRDFERGGSGNVDRTPPTDFVRVMFPREIAGALKAGVRPYIPGGYHSKEERESIRASAEEIVGYPLKISYSGERLHRYYLDKMEKKMDTFTKGKIAKVDTGLGLVFGWAIVCKVDGEPYFDLQGDHVPETAMLNATCDFMVNSRLAKEMHNGPAKGAVLFSFPLTDEIAKAMGITSAYTGWMVAMKPDDPALLQKFRDGVYTGFSIGGSRIKDKELD